MGQIELIATSTFGLESLVKRELLKLGYTDLKVENGKVTFKGEEKDIAKTNIWLRTADRVFLKMGEFKALTFNELFEKTKALPWEEWIDEDGEFTVNGKSVDSKLFSISDCQAIVKKAVVEKLKTKYKTEWFKETGAKFTILVSILKDVATLSIDTSGEALHMRGYRKMHVNAPVKETIAAAMIQLSYWSPERILIDPFCGSGTIPIEAAMIGKNIAPGIQRSFAAEDWKKIKREYWKEEKIFARKSIIQERELKIFGYDIDKEAVKIARENTYEMGVDDCITYETKDALQLSSKKKYGVIVSNPPYGERMGEKEKVEDLYRKMGEVFSSLDTWSLYFLTSNEEFEKIYGRRADRRRKLFNGKIKVNYYQFYGPRPKKRN